MTKKYCSIFRVFYEFDPFKTYRKPTLKLNIWPLIKEDEYLYKTRTDDGRAYYFYKGEEGRFLPPNPAIDQSLSYKMWIPLPDPHDKISPNSRQQISIIYDTFLCEIRGTLSTLEHNLHSENSTLDARFRTQKEDLSRLFS